MLLLRSLFGIVFGLLLVVLGLRLGCCFGCCSGCHLVAIWYVFGGAFCVTSDLSFGLQFVSQLGVVVWFACWFACGYALYCLWVCVMGCCFGCVIWLSSGLLFGVAFVFGLRCGVIVGAALRYFVDWRFVVWVVFIVLLVWSLFGLASRCVWGRCVGC